MKLLVTGATGFTGQLFIKYLERVNPQVDFACLIRDTSKLKGIHNYEDKRLDFQHFYGDSSLLATWKVLSSQYLADTIIHIASIRHVPEILRSLNGSANKPRLIIVGTTGVYSRYNQLSENYKDIERQLIKYPGSYCLLRPTMIYGSHRDKNLHKLIKFCDRYGFFPVFGSGKTLLQPVHADDLAQSLLAVLLNPKVEGAYDLSGGTVVNFIQLLALVEKLLGKPIRPLYIPYRFGVWSATLLEMLLGKRSPIRREQILRLQEDKAYSHEAAAQAFGYAPRSLEVGLAEEIEILRTEGIISR